MRTATQEITLWTHQPQEGEENNLSFSIGGWAVSPDKKPNHIQQELTTNLAKHSAPRRALSKYAPLMNIIYLTRNGVVFYKFSVIEINIVTERVNNTYRKSFLAWLIQTFP